MPPATPRVLRCLLPLFCALAVFADVRGAEQPWRDEFVVKAWETDDGLPHNQVAVVLPRRDGFLWVATLGGIARFDGIEFARVDSPLLHGVQSSNIIDVIEENAATLVISSNQSGLVRLRRGEATLHPLNAQLAPRARPLLLFREADDVFWVLAADRTLVRWAQGEVRTFPPPPDVRTSWPASFARDGQAILIARGAGVERYESGRLEPVEAVPKNPVVIAAARNGGIWMATAGQLARLAGDAISVVAQPPPWSTPQPPTALFEDRHGTLWIGAAAQGLLRWQDGRTDAIATSHTKITALSEDQEGNIWAGTAGGGLDRVQRRQLTRIASEPDWAESQVASICEDSAGAMWFANRNAVRKIHPDGRVEIVSADRAWPRRAAPVVADRAGNIWFSVNGDIYRACPERAEPPRLVDRIGTETHVIYPTRDGSVWIGSTGRVLERVRPNGKVQRFGGSTGFRGHNVRTIAEDPAGHVWLGTSDGHLFEWDGHKFADWFEPLGLMGHPIRALHGDAEGRLWIGTVGAGVLLLAGGSVHEIGRAKGFPDDVISHILEDDYGWLWFGSQRGIFKVRKQDLADCALGRTAEILPISFGRADGLSGVSAIGNYQPTAWKSRRGELWFVTRKGLIRAHPAPPDDDPPALRVYLEPFRVDGQPWRATSAREPRANAGSPLPRIASSAHRLDFYFTAPNFTAPDRVRFRYRLDGFDNDWIEGGVQRWATYPALSPGRYRFTVNASSIDGAWTPALATMDFEVTPAWWETWWARTLAVSLAIAAVVALVLFWSHRRLKARLARAEEQRRLEHERVRIARDLHDDLGASLTHASMMAEELAEDWRELPDPQAQTLHLAQRVRTIARDLDAVVWTVSPKNDRLDSLAAYLCHFAAEYFRPTSVECHARAADDVPALPLSPDVRHHLFMIAKELLANVLKHAQATRVQVTMRAHDGAFELAVADNGRGFSVAAAETSCRNGLRNLHARAAEVGGTIDLATSPEGTTVTLRFPLPAAPRASVDALPA